MDFTGKDDETIIQNIREDKEEQFQYGFLQELFDKALDYTINPNPDFNLTTASPRKHYRREVVPLQKRDNLST